MPSNTPQYARVAINRSIDRLFDYRIPEDLCHLVSCGSMVDVQFGKRRARGTVIEIIANTDVPPGKIRDILEVVTEKALVRPSIMELARWMSDYYAAPLETVLQSVLPSAVRRKGRSFRELLHVYPTALAEDAGAVARLRRVAPKQALAMDILMTGERIQLSELARAAEVSVATIKGLEKKGLVTICSETVYRDPRARDEWVRTAPLQLMPQQQDALSLIQNSIDTQKPPVVLLHGVTGSGKTEVYLQAIQYALDRDLGAIVLVPEISLTPQAVERFSSRFGGGVAVLHSHLSEGERHDEWHRIFDGSARIVVGARSALFAPVRKLGLIVVDEEHENSYKQEESPRYHARDVAVMRGHREGATVVLGSATPSLESVVNVQQGKYGMAVMPYRVDHRSMPVLRVVDMRHEASDDKHFILSTELASAIRLRLERAEQTILFLNRRGYSATLVCSRCGYVAECTQCSVSMTYHKKIDRLACHFCGDNRPVPRACPNPECNDPGFRYAGVGTERVEEILCKLFPGATIQRVDSDTMKRKDSYHRVLGDFKTGKIDILIGTQMIAKGLHFPNVTLVGVVYADVILHMPDFRAGERTYQLLTQVAGRAGRGDVKGEVIVQTFTPMHPAVQAARRMDFASFCDQELEFRRELNYPPYSHVIALLIRCEIDEKARRAAEDLAAALAPHDERLWMRSEPAPAPISRIKGWYRYQIMLRTRRVVAAGRAVRKIVNEMKWTPKVQCTVDVDALSML